MDIASVGTTVPYVAGDLCTQFQERLGRSASDLLTDIRMTLAANELRKSSFPRRLSRKGSGISPKPPSSAPSSKG